MKINGAIFDLDGTLLDSMGMWVNAGSLYLSTLGIKARESLGTDLIQMNMEEGALFIKDEYDLNLSRQEIIEGIIETLKDTYAHKIEVKPGVLSFLQFLKEKRIPCIILTSSDKAMFEAALIRNGLLSFFSKIFTCSELKMSKSNPDIYRVAAEEFNSPSENILVFEDAPYALESALKAGFYTVGIYDANTLAGADIAEAEKNSSVFCMNFDEVLRHLKTLLD